MIYWEKIEIDGQEVLNVMNPAIKLSSEGFQNVFKELSEEEIDKFKESVPKEYSILPLYVNGFSCIDCLYYYDKPATWNKVEILLERKREKMITYNQKSNNCTLKITSSLRTIFKTLSRMQKDHLKHLLNARITKQINR